MRKRLPLIITLCLVAVGIVLAVVFIGRAPETPDVQTAVVNRGDLVITAPVRGNLAMPDKAHLSFGITGTVKEVLVARGDSVEEGQILARLDAPSLELNVEMAELQVEMARTQLRMARAQYDKAGESWQAPDGFEFLEDVIDLLVGLMGPDQDSARASLDMARLNLELAELGLEAAELNLEMAVIKAPIDGVVADITIREGQTLSAAMLAAPAISVIDTGRIEMRGLIDELDITLVEVGQEVDIRLDAMRDREVKGKLAFVSPIGTVMFGVVSYDAVITLEGTHEDLRDGMSATADVIIERRHNVLLVPNRAIRGTREEPIVEVYVDEQIEQRRVTLGLSDGIDVEVLSGLEEGEEVVLPARGTSPVGFFGDRGS
ncbi:MAG: efflux RND transporter periplasmic adaptor subunit [Dehalococcoidia bacterium]|nr:efflux RND transporter periplasmic adaptor subunit [Dehalococcoidia bacterium]